MDDVRVYYNSPKPAGLQALAYIPSLRLHQKTGSEVIVPIQRKAGKLPTEQSLSSQAWRGISIFSSTHRYEDVLDKMVEYESNITTQDNDYGLQLFRLREMNILIHNWEGGYGSVDQVDNGTSRKSNRRRQLKRLKDAIPIEESDVQDQGFNAAKQKQINNRKALADALQAGLLSQDIRTKNSADWIMNAQKTSIYAEEPTGDSYIRLRTANEIPSQAEAFFPKGRRGAAGDLLSGAVYYNRRSYADTSNVEIQDNGKVLGGWRDEGAIAIVSPSTKTQDKILEIVRHEVQHDSDRNVGRDAMSSVRSGYDRFEELLLLGHASGARMALKAAGAEIKLQKYKTEFRAYSYEQSGYENLDNITRDQQRGGKLFTRRQVAIFDHIYQDYDYAKDGWDNNPTLPDGRKFRQAVADYINPDVEGFNKFNSARIDDFYIALDGIGTKRAKTNPETKMGKDFRPVDKKESNENDQSVNNLIKAINSLDEIDVDYIQNNAPAITAKIAKHLDGKALQRVQVALQIRKLDIELIPIETSLSNLMQTISQWDSPSFNIKKK